MQLAIGRRIVVHPAPHPDCLAGRHAWVDWRHWLPAAPDNHDLDTLAVCGTWHCCQACRTCGRAYCYWRRDLERAATAPDETPDDNGGNDR